MKPNKLNKILTLLFIFMCSMMLLNNQVKADAYNGKGGIVGSKVRPGDSCSFNWCAKNNQRHTTVKVSVWYIDSNGNWKGTDSNNPYSGVFWSNDTNFVKNTLGFNVQFIDVDQSIWNGVTNSNSRKFEILSQNIARYFGCDNETGTCNDVNNIRGYLDKVYPNWRTDFNLKSEPSSKTKEAVQGYRIIIEPVISYIADNTYYLTTVKERAGLGISDKNNSYSFDDIAQFFYTSWNDVHVKSFTANECRGKSMSEVASIRNGCGYNIIDITKGIDLPKCYSTTVERNNPVCRNSDRNNIGTYSEKYSEIPCDGSDVTEQQKTNTEYGKLMNSTREDCNIYCIESATTNFPGSISSKLSLNMVPSEGAYFAWPTMRSRNGLYTMSMTSKFTCRIVRKGNSCDTNTLVNAVKSKIESNEMKFGAKLTAGTNRKINTESLVKDGDPIDKSNTSGASNFSNNVSGEITFERTQYLKINGSTNRYYNRVTDATSDSKPNSNDNLKNIFDRKQGVVSLKKNDDTNNDYKLVLSNISLGSNNIFGTDDAYSYVCSYAITNDSCLCPEGSPKSEFDIYHELTEEELKGKTCSQLQQEYCYDNSGYYCVLPSKEKKNITTCVQNKIKEGLTTTEAIDKCTEEDPDCKNICQNKKTGELVNIEDCMNRNNNNYAFCENVYCRSNIPCETCCVDNGDNCEWVKKDAKLFKKKCVNDGITYDDCEDKKFSCPGGEENMKDPTTCFTNGLKGTGYGSIEAALNAGREDLVNKIFHSCQIEVCPSGKKIIYRVIDLNDPFPGKTGNKKTGLTGFSNTGGRSRKPGSNWNSTELVSKKILNARGAKGYKLYTEKQPLYKITLTPSIIKEIRKYNKSTNYSDFTLNCTGDNKSSKCISKFIHEELKQKGTNVVEGLCASITNSGEFDECYGGGN